MRVVKHKSKKRRFHFSLELLAGIMICVSVPLWFISSVFLRTTNAALSVSCQKLENEAKTLKKENINLRQDIVGLENKDRVYVIATESGMVQDHTKITNIKSSN